MGSERNRKELTRTSRASTTKWREEAGEAEEDAFAATMTTSDDEDASESHTSKNSGRAERALAPRVDIFSNDRCAFGGSFSR